jgi:transposase-like protein
MIQAGKQPNFVCMTTGSEVLQPCISSLLDDEKCFAFVREQRWKDGVRCVKCESAAVVRNGHDESQPQRQHYKCNACQQRFDDLTGTIFSGRHQALKVWILCLYFMGLNLSNRQIAGELNICISDVQGMTEELRQGIIAKAPQPELENEIEIDEVYVIAGHKGQPDAVQKKGDLRGDAD